MKNGEKGGQDPTTSDCGHRVDDRKVYGELGLFIFWGSGDRAIERNGRRYGWALPEGGWTKLYLSLAASGCLSDEVVKGKDRWKEFSTDECCCEFRRFVYGVCRSFRKGRKGSLE